MLALLHKLPIDLSMEGRKEQLKKSELGRYVMFYSKLPDETLPNRQLARGLVEKWSRPIFEQFRERAQDEEMQVSTPSRISATQILEGMCLSSCCFLYGIPSIKDDHQVWPAHGPSNPAFEHKSCLASYHSKDVLLPYTTKLPLETTAA